MRRYCTFSFITHKLVHVTYLLGTSINVISYGGALLHMRKGGRVSFPRYVARMNQWENLGRWPLCSSMKGYCTF